MQRESSQRRATREIAASVGRTLYLESRRNELVVAWARAIATSLMAIGDTLSYLNPEMAPALPAVPLAMPLTSGTAAVVSIALLVVLRKRFHGSFRYIMPAVDAVLITAGFVVVRSAFGAEAFAAIGGAATALGACTLLAASGGLRLTRGSAMLSTGLSIVAFSITALPLQPFTPNIGIQVGLLLSVGLLSVWMTGIVRRAVKSEVGRAMLTRFLPRQVIDSAHQDPMSLVTRPQSLDATVMVTDLRGFTAMSETLSPAGVLEFLNEFQGALATVVREHGGTVDKFMGDGMLAVFGAPERLEDHAARAIHATDSILRVIETLNSVRVQLGQPTVRVGVGVHSGPVVSGCLGSGLRLEFTVIGDTVNTASRLESMTKQKGVTTLISEETRRRATTAPVGTGPAPSSAGVRPIEGSLPDLQSLGEVEIRGRREPLDVHTMGAPPPTQTQVRLRSEVVLPRD